MTDFSYLGSERVVYQWGNLQYYFESLARDARTPRSVANKIGSATAGRSWQTLTLGIHI